MVKKYSSIISQYSLLLYIFFLPIDFHFSSLVLIAFYVSILFQIDWLEIKKKIKYFLPFLLISLIYLYHILVNHDQNNGLNFLYLFTLIFLIQKVNEDWYRKYLQGFLIGIVVGWMLCMLYPFVYCFDFYKFTFTPIVKSTNIFNDFNFLNYFISQQFTKTVMDRAYFAMYLNIALCIIIYKNVIPSRLKYWAILFLFFAIIQSNSFMGYIVFCSNIAIYLFFRFIPFLQKFSIQIMSFIIAVLILSFVSISIFNSKIKVDLPIDNSNNEISRLDYRKFLWSNASELCQNPSLLGIGVDNTQNQLDSIFLAKTAWTSHWVKGKFNTHNQYYQFILEIGILGLVLYFLAILIPFYLARNKDFNGLFFSFIMTILLFSISESIFERYNGIGLIMFFYSLFLNKTINESE